MSYLLPTVCLTLTDQSNKDTSLHLRSLLVMLLLPLMLLSSTTGCMVSINIDMNISTNISIDTNIAVTDNTEYGCRSIPKTEEEEPNRMY